MLQHLVLLWNEDETLCPPVMSSSVIETDLKVHLDFRNSKERNTRDLQKGSVPRCFSKSQEAHFSGCSNLIRSSVVAVILFIKTSLLSWITISTLEKEKPYLLKFRN